MQLDATGSAAIGALAFVIGLVSLSAAPVSGAAARTSMSSRTSLAILLWTSSLVATHFLGWTEEQRLAATLVSGTLAFVATIGVIFARSQRSVSRAPC